MPAALRSALHAQNRACAELACSLRKNFYRGGDGPSRRVTQSSKRRASSLAANPPQGGGGRRAVFPGRRTLQTSAPERDALCLDGRSSMPVLTRPRPLQLLYAAFAAAAGLVLCSNAALSADKVTFLTSWFAQAEHGGFYQAKATGLYQKAGLDVTLKIGGPQINGMQLL